MKTLKMFAFAAVSLAISMMPVFGVNRYVSADRDYGSGPNGEVITGDKTYATIKDAISAANAGDTVWVKDGFICEEQYKTSTKQKLCYTTVGVDKAITLRSQSGDARTGNPPVIRGKVKTGSESADASNVEARLDGGDKRAMYVSAEATIIGFVLENGGTAKSNNGITGANAHGGGGVMTTAAATFEKCVIRNNYGDYGGGIMTDTHATGGWDLAPTFNDCVITNNWAWYQGGGATGRATFNRCVIAFNNVTNSSTSGFCAGVHGGYTARSNYAIVRDSFVTNNVNWGAEYCGGAMNVRATNTLIANNRMRSGPGGGAQESVLVNCQVLNNRASNGGGIQDCIATNCLIAGNAAVGTAQNAGGGGVKDGVIVNCIITNNIAYNNGGGMMFTTTAFTNLCNRIVGNRAYGIGGGIYDKNGGEHYGCLIADNLLDTESSVTAAGAASTWSGTESSKRYIRLINCTVVSNRVLSGSAVGGVYMADLVNTVVHGNLDAKGKASNCGTVRSATNSCATVINAASRANCQLSDPLFVPGTYGELSRRSPCRDHGWLDPENPVLQAAKNNPAHPFYKDIGGRRRVQGNGADPAIDIGCYEYVPKGFLFLLR